MNIKILADADTALDKLFQYGYLPARQVFFLSTLQQRVLEALGAYYRTRNNLLTKYGTSADGETFTVEGTENIAAYKAELRELEEQDVAVEFPESGVRLCVETIENTDKDLPAEKRLGFSALDWLAVGKVLTVKETEG